ncbi:fimbrial protein [Proteus myxofaciens]|uniref:FimG family fimbrial adaptor subunit n=1 Tax=Proteus myxofaciens ATCC 19692 TaxID=1354337 RepID=A0A198GCV8_9GAMM|nr:fimbrial protein [Proteus myxofaciens]OAT34745.1 FimG family fimbrial adaptor subunit [Proteus myxofaciens ATCC 19692]
MIKYISIIMLCLFNFPSLTYAQTIKTSNVTINGSVLAKPCTIIPSDKIVDLGDIFTYKMNPYSDWVDFDITMINCPNVTNNVSAAFVGDFNTQGDYFINKGTSTNIGIQIQNKDNSAFIRSGSVINKTISNVDNSNVVFNLSARVIKLNGPTLSGTLQSIINVTYTWA